MAFEMRDNQKPNQLDNGVIEGDFKNLPELKTSKPYELQKMSANPKPTPEQIAKKSKILSGRNMFGGAFVGYDIYSRMQEGEGAIAATAKALGTNALFAALPGGIVGGIAITAGVAAASMAPELYDMMESKKAELSGVTNTFNTTFEENEGQIANRQQGMEQQRQAEQYGLDRMRRHARGAHSSY